MIGYRQYDKWLTDTIPKLEEWAESDADDKGHCPLSQDEANWLLGAREDNRRYIDALEKELIAMKADLESANDVVHLSRIALHALPPDSVIRGQLQIGIRRYDELTGGCDGISKD